MAGIDLVSDSPQKTQEFGASLGQLLRGGELICLEGELGSGKTTFIQGIGRGLGVDGPITSPTFTLVNEYRGESLTFYHVDLYRVGSRREIMASGLDDLFFGDGVCAIEWAEKARGLVPPERLWIILKHGEEGRRLISMEAVGPGYEYLLSSLERELTRRRR
ncbi:MAG: tRNA (adenosine(37)-N6)-threonylcarbamoyltransferase complex ATPase subunit type 1 TsaE [Anaerolineae bacterium]